MNDYYRNLPKKRVAAGSLFFNDARELFIVKPTYKEGWSIPGGNVDANESPRDACVREIKEEIGLDKPDQKFLCVDYQPDRGDGESLQFLFLGGTLDFQDISRIRLQAEELGEYRFVSIDDAMNMLRRGLRQRLAKCLEAMQNKTSFYLEKGLD